VGGFIWAAIIPTIAVNDGWRQSARLLAVALLVLTLVPVIAMIRNKPADVGLVPYGADAGAAAEVAAGRRSAGVLPGFTYRQALKSPWMWVAAGSFLVFGAVVAVTQVLAIVLKTAAYANPIDQSTWTPDQIAVYSSLFMIWTLFLILWKPVLGFLNDRIGLLWIMIISCGLMTLAFLYIPSMTYGSAVPLMYATMVFVSCGISNATVTPPLVIASAMGPREFGKIFSLAVAFYYLGNALGAPLWGALGSAGQYDLGMYLAPILLGLFVIGAWLAATRGKDAYTTMEEAEAQRYEARQPAVT
jgi:hypothetical protein